MSGSCFFFMIPDLCPSTLHSHTAQLSSEEREKARAETIELLRTMPWRQEILRRRGDLRGFGVRRNCASDEFPRLYVWTHNLKKAALIRDNLPDADKLAGIYKRLYEQRQWRILTFDYSC
ncbi:uncharacterized protein LOC111479812 [Cucurbita maxima]|uniref:Uncharacterized protein LOC111479812 n=1 Tax=Cucurbita maxima TaxID=3661 RepID=A0A6J1IWB9_CUCMA|nr:uncharacterized protein LOC111479812 [Cucurbita maxima]